MQKARQHCQALKIAADYFDDRFFAGTRFKRLEIHLPNRVRILGLPANPVTARGFTGDVLLDEFAMHADDRDIWAAMFPTLLRGQGELDVCSTPKGIKNVFAQLRDNPLFSHSTLTLPQAIDQGLDVDYEQVRRAMGDDQLFRQEFLCEFLDEATAFLTYEMIARCEDPTLTKEPDLDVLARLRGDLAVGIDVGRRRDLTVVWIVAVEGDQRITRGVIEMQNVTFREQYARIGAVLRCAAVRRCWHRCRRIGHATGRNGERGLRPAPRRGVHVHAAAQAGIGRRVARRGSKMRRSAFRWTRPSATTGTAWSGRSRRPATTVTRAGHGEGGHADRFWAAALVLRAAGGRPGPAEVLSVQPLRFAREGAW